MAPKRKRLAAADSPRKRGKGGNSNTSKKTNPKSTLFTLPAELRNRIYELALVTSDQDTRIRVRPQLKFPGLLSTCRQARAEAHKIYWFQNKFNQTVRDCNGSLHIKFERLLFDNMGEAAFQIDFTLIVAGRKSWANLLEWCRQLHADENGSSGLRMDPNWNAQETVVAAAHRIAFTHGESTWECCLEALGALRAVAGLSSKKWLDD